MFSNGKDHSSPVDPYLLTAQLTAQHGSYLFQLFASHSPNLLWIINEHEQLVYANTALRRYFGINSTQLGKPLQQLLPPDVGNLLHHHFTEEWKAKNYFTEQLTVTNVEGEKRMFRVHSFKLHHLAQQLWGGIAVDVTDKQGLEDALYECNEKWIAFTHSAAQGVWEWDTALNFLQCNNTIKEWMAATKDADCTVQKWLQYIHADDREEATQQLQQAIAGNGMGWEGSYRFVTTAGETKNLLCRGIVIRHAQKPPKLVASVLDVTEITDLESRLAKERSEKEQTLAAAVLEVQEKERTHIGQELHDNVAQLVTTAKLLLRMIEPAAPEQQELKTKCENYLVSALSEIRLLSKQLVVPELYTRPMEECFSELVSDLRTATAVPINYYNNATAVNGLEGAKKLALYRILQEATKNIVKHAQASSINISLREEAGIVALEVRDNGVGFNPEKVRRGVGLTSIFDRAKIFGGNVKIESVAGKGTRLLVIFPFDQSDEDTAA